MHNEARAQSWSIVRSYHSFPFEGIHLEFKKLQGNLKTCEIYLANRTAPQDAPCSLLLISATVIQPQVICTYVSSPGLVYRVIWNTCDPHSTHHFLNNCYQNLRFKFKVRTCGDTRPSNPDCSKIAILKTMWGSINNASASIRTNSN